MAGQRRFKRSISFCRYARPLAPSPLRSSHVRPCPQTLALMRSQPRRAHAATPRAALALAAASLALTACMPRPGEMVPRRPFTRCAAFEFHVPDEQALKQAQLLMVEAAIDMDLRFEADNPMGGFVL